MYAFYIATHVELLTALPLDRDTDEKIFQVADVPKGPRADNFQSLQDVGNAADPPLGPRAERPDTEHHKVELPYQVIHAIVSAVQSILEDLLFDFATKHIPRLLQAEGWMVPVQGELSEWDRSLRLYRGDVDFTFRAHNVNCSPSELFMKLARLRHLRHTS